MRQPTYFISHGGGPWPWVPNMRQAFAALEESLAQMPSDLPEPPKAVLMISGHWEASRPRVMHSAQPPMVYDYYGFPPDTYQITYSAPGAPELAEQVAGLLRGAGFQPELDDTQGFDHGTFVPAYIMYPEAKMPIIQLSMLHGYDPQAHFKMGQALATLRDEGVLIVGSGLSYHNLRNFGPAAKEPSMGFDKWLGETLEQDTDTRREMLMNWEAAPYARAAHAQEDHLVPLFVALGAAEAGKATRTYHEDDIFGGVTASSWRFD